MNFKVIEERELEFEAYFENEKTKNLEAIFDQFDVFYSKNPFLGEEKLIAIFTSDFLLENRNALHEEIINSTQQKNLLLEDVLRRYLFFLNEANPEYRFNHLCIAKIPELQVHHRNKLAQLENTPANYAFQTEWIYQSDPYKWLTLIAKYDVLSEVINGEFNLFTHEKITIVYDEHDLSLGFLPTNDEKQPDQDNNTSFDNMPQKARIMLFHYLFQFNNANDIYTDRSQETRFLTLALNKTINPKYGYNRDIYNELEYANSDTKPFQLSLELYNTYLTEYIIPLATTMKYSKPFITFLRDKIKEL